MRYFYAFFGFIFTGLLFTNCGGTKNLQEVPPANFGQAYFIQKENTLTLYLPVNAIQTEIVSLDSVYFRSRKAPLNLVEGNYIAEFRTGKQDMIMSSDPKDEYGNKLPVKLEKPPFDLDDDEAILVFTKDGQVQYFKLEGIEEGITLK